MVFLKNGESYKSRSGEVFGPLKHIKYNGKGCVTPYTFTDGTKSWTATGDYDGMNTHPYDLMKEVVR